MIKCYFYNGSYTSYIILEFKHQVSKFILFFNLIYKHTINAGEVLCLNTTIDESMNIKSAKISGPMTMYPSADDNYSEDASSILILDTVPPSVVIASNFGQLYNCLLLPDTKNKVNIKKKNY